MIKNDKLLFQIFASLKPKPKMNGLEWAKKYGYLSAENSAITGRFKPYKYQEALLLSGTDEDVAEIWHPKSARVGYALALDTKIPTPNGWTSIRECKINDIIFDENGKQCKITYKSKIFKNHNCYEIEFSDGTKIEADEAHRWFLKSVNVPVLKDGYFGAKYEGILNTKELFEKHKFGKNKRNSFYIENTKPLICESKILPVPSYTLGLWLGDGHSVSPRITQYRYDLETENYINKEKIKTRIGFDDKRYENNGTIYLENMIQNFKSMNLISTGGKCNTKHIPKIYFRGSISQRLELLRGLMDSDGTIGLNGRAEFNNTNKRLIDGVFELLMTLGYKATVNKRKTKNKSHHLDQWRVNFKAVQELNPFNLKRKAQRVLPTKKSTITYGRYIVNVKKINTIHTQCISVDSKSELFLCSESMIPTHNTKILNMLVGYHISEAPCPQLMFNPNDKKANEWSKKELKPLLRDMQIVGEKIVRSRQDDTVNFKVYPGGVFESRGGNAAANYAAATAKRVNLDEVDRFPDDVDGEGSPIELAIKRTATFWDSQAIFGSTPTITGISKIEEGFKKTDMCYFYVPCPHCGQFQIINFKNIIWDKEFRQGVLTHLFQTAYLKCIHCEEKILHKSKKSITNQGEWRQTQKFFCCDEWQDPKENNKWDKVTDKKYIAEALCKTCNKTAEYNRNGRKKRGFHIWAGYSLSPDADWSNIAEVFVEAKDATSRNKMKVFKNVWLGESYEDKTIKLDGDDLYNQRENYTLVSNDAVVLLMTVDTQDTWLAYEIKEWKAGEISRGLLYGNVLGDPMNKSVWEELKKISEQDFTTEDGRIVKVFKVFIDLAGHKTDHVKNFVRGNQDRFIMLKGSSNEPKENDARPMATLTMPKKGDLPIMWVATTKAKDTIFERLTLKKGDYGYMYYNMNFDLEWFAQLTAEKVVFKLNAKGYMERTYIKRRNRNEAIDLEAYQLAAVRLLQDMGLIDLAIPNIV